MIAPNPIPNALMIDTLSPLERVMAGWLHEKVTRTGSAKTHKAYRVTILAFREYLKMAGFDLDSDRRAIAEAAQVWAGLSRVPGRHVSSATYNQRLAILSSFYTYAIKAEALDTNPIDRVQRRPVHGYESASPLNANEVRRRLKEIDRSTPDGKRDYALLSVALTTGRRAAELANLRWRDLQVIDNQILVTWSRCKGGKVMSDKLDAKVSGALLDYLHNIHGAELGRLPADTPIWARTCRNAAALDATKPLTYQAIRDICEHRLGTSKVHVLRHTFAHRMEANGAKTSDIQSKLGHESLDTTSRYLKALNQAENPQAALIVEDFGID